MDRRQFQTSEEEFEDTIKGVNRSIMAKGK